MDNIAIGAGIGAILTWLVTFILTKVTRDDVIYRKELDERIKEVKRESMRTATADAMSHELRKWTGDCPDRQAACQARFLSLIGKLEHNTEGFRNEMAKDVRELKENIHTLVWIVADELKIDRSKLTDLIR